MLNILIDQLFRPALGIGGGDSKVANLRDQVTAPWWSLSSKIYLHPSQIRSKTTLLRKWSPCIEHIWVQNPLTVNLPLYWSKCSCVKKKNPAPSGIGTKDLLLFSLRTSYLNYNQSQSLLLRVTDLVPAHLSGLFSIHYSHYSLNFTLLEKFVVSKLLDNFIPSGTIGSPA